jgi:hypothetical protein
MEGVEDFAGDIAFETADDVVFRFCFGEAPRHVVAGGLVSAQACHEDDVQSAVGRRGCIRVRCPMPNQAFTEGNDRSGAEPPGCSTGPGLPDSVTLSYFSRLRRA